MSFITEYDVDVLDEIARRYEGRNIVNQSRQITSDVDAKLFVMTLQKVANRIREIAKQRQI